MSRLHLPRIVIDTREQLPYEFSGYQTVRKKLDTGDYSLTGYEDRVAVERKTKEDAYGCVGASRARFKECLGRLGALYSPCIVIECSIESFAVPPTHTKIHPSQALGSYISWSAHYRIPVFWCPNRDWAEKVTVKFLEAFYRHHVVAGDQAMQLVAGADAP